MVIDIITFLANQHVRWQSTCILFFERYSQLIWRGEDVACISARHPLRIPPVAKVARVHIHDYADASAWHRSDTAVFSVMNAVVFELLPVPRAQELMHVRMANGQGSVGNSSNTGGSNTAFTKATFEQLRQRSDVFEELIAYVPLALSKVAVRHADFPRRGHSRRTAEIGIRIAFGATRTQMLVMVLREALWVLLAGFAVGIPYTLRNTTAEIDALPDVAARSYKLCSCDHHDDLDLRQLCACASSPRCFD